MQALTGLAVAGGTWGLRVAAANEQAQISFTTMLGSAEAAGTFIADLQAFAAKTPFEFSGLQQSAASLISVGISADKVIPIMTSLGNATSGMGTGAEGISRATTALQQMNAAGKISGEDLNQLRDAGIPVFDLLTAATGKSTAAIAEMAAKGKLGREELDQLMSALESGQGLERFAGLMDQQSASLTGMWSTMKDTLGQGLARVVQPWVPAIKEALGDATGAAGPFLDQLTGKSAEFAARAPIYISKVRVAFRDARAGVDDFLAGLRGNGAIEGTNTTLHSLGTTLNRVRTAFTTSGGGAQALDTAMKTVNDTMAVGGVVVGFLAGHVDTLATLLPWLAAGWGLVKAVQLASNIAAIVAVPTHLAQVGATFSLASANRALAGSLAGSTLQTTGLTVAENTGMVTRARNVAGMVVQKAAMVAGAAATGVMTAGQWLLNSAFLASPLTWVVLGIAALIAGVVLAYQKLDWFREMVGWVWDKLQDLWDIAGKVGSAIGGFFGFGDDDEGGRAPSIPGRAAGGSVEGGRPYIVGEKRRELFVPEVDGMILPRVPRQRGRGNDGALAGVATGMGGSGDLTVPLVIDGREIGRATINDFRQRQARK